MRALSLRQPWLYAVLYLGKHVENRRWRRKVEGDVLLHAAKGCTQKEYDAAVQWMVGRGLISPSDLPPLDKLTRGGICGRCRFTGDVHAPASTPQAPWHMEDQWGYVLSDVTPLPFVECQGALGFFEVPPEVMGKLGLVEPASVDPYAIFDPFGGL
jgi:hypothetical protein